MPLRKHFDESKHKRGPKGSSSGGKFVRKDGGASEAENHAETEDEVKAAAEKAGFTKSFMGGFEKENRFAQARVKRSVSGQSWTASVSYMDGRHPKNQTFPFIEDALSYSQDLLAGAGTRNKKALLKTMQRHGV
jgi:hypothetical protein